MSIQDPPPHPDDERQVDEDLQETPPPRLSPPLEADEADVLEQTLEVPPADDGEL